MRIGYMSSRPPYAIKLNLQMTSRMLASWCLLWKIISISRSSRLVNSRQRIKAGRMYKMRLSSLWKASMKVVMQRAASHMVAMRMVSME